MANIGFIGLGHMGLPMALNLLKAGHSVKGFDLNPEALDFFANSGGQAATNLSEITQGQHVFITMLQTGEQVKQICLGKDGLFASAIANSLHIDCSTIDVQSSKEIHQQAAINQISTVDAPVSGGVKGAVAASLTFLVGGDKNSFERASPILSAMGTSIIYTGGPGTGQSAKICNNLILGVSMIAISEALALGERLGLSAKTLYEVVNSSSGQCWAMSHYIPIPNVLPNVPANNGYPPGFSAIMMLKDLKLSQHAAATTSLKTPLGEKATTIYQQFIEAGFGDLDFSAIIKTINGE